ncbi:MAG: DMT family transporter [Solirubrobacteraceae bacterium]
MNTYKFYGVLMVVFGAFFYSTKAILIKLGFLKSTQDGLDFLMLRMLFSFPFYFIVLIIQTKKKNNFNSKLPNLKEHFIIASTGFLGYYLASYWDFVGLQYITANLERVILFIYPSVVLIFGALYYNRKINKTQIISIAICWLGIAIAYYSDKVVTSNLNILKGSIYILAAGIAYGLYLSLSENVIKKFGSIYYTALSMIVSCFAVFIHYFSEKGFSALF